MFATIAERRKEIMTKESKFDQKWMENLTAYVDYVKSNYRFPGNQTVYQDRKIGYWIANQISAKKKDCLLEERKRLLDCFMPPWDKTKKEKQQYLDELLKIDWEMHVPSEKHSLFKVAGFEYTHNMRQLHLSGIHTCEDYIVFIAKKNVAKEKLCSMYCKIYPFLTESTALFLCTLFDIHYKDLSDPEKMEAFFLQFPYPTKRHTENRIQKMLLKLSKKQRTIMEKKLGLYGEPMSYQAIGEAYQLTREAIRQQYMKALFHLRTPKSQKLLLMTETDLDLYCLSPLTKGILYRNNIHTVKQMNELCHDHSVLKILPSSPAYRQNVMEEITHNLYTSHKNATSLEEYQLSFRSYNALRRFGISNYGELMEYCGAYPEKRLLEIPGLGKGSVQEICQKVVLPKEGWVHDDNRK